MAFALRNRFIVMSAAIILFTLHTIYNSSNSKGSDNHEAISQSRRSINDIPRSYGYAEEFFAAIGYRRCPAKSDKQEAWMHLSPHRKFADCAKIFSDFVELESRPLPAWPPPREIPADLVNDFTLWGRIPTKAHYFAEKFNKADLSPLLWDENGVQALRNMAARNSTNIGWYGEATLGVYRALAAYPLDGQRGFVVGSINPWLEATILELGHAAHVLTVEYYPIVSTYDKISYIHPLNLSLRWREFADQFDFMFSFSSIEHSGLGRFGDQVDPFGDLVEMAKASCLVKKGGLVFVGFEYGQDGVYWNAHRCYGQWRLPLITAGFEVLGVFQPEGRLSEPLRAAQMATECSQPTIVLRNLRPDSCA